MFHSQKEQGNWMLTIYTICPIPGTIVGVKQSLKEQLKKRIQILVKAIPTLAQNAKVRVKVTEDADVRGSPLFTTASSYV